MARRLKGIVEAEAKVSESPEKKVLKSRDQAEGTQPRTWVSVICDMHSRVTRRRDPESSYDGDDKEHSPSIRGISVGGEWGDFDVTFPVTPGKVYYLVSVIYDTGDSFHRETGCVEHVDLFEEMEKAEILAKRIADHSRVSSGDLILFTNSGAEYRGFMPWQGYFSRFKEALVTPVLVGAKSFR